MRDKIQKALKKVQNLPAVVNDLRELKRKEDIKEVDIEFMTDSSAATLEGVPVRYHIILVASMAFLFIALIWASFATLDVVTVGQGKVIPSSNMQVIQNLEGGIVKDIRVKIGDVVEKDQVLMIIDDTRFVSSLKENETQMAALKAKLIRLGAETNGEELKFPSELEQQYPQYVNAEKNLYESRKKELQVKLNILKDEAEQKKQELMGARQKKDQLQRSLDLVKKELNLTKPLISQGAVSEVEVLRLERTVNDLSGDLEQTDLSIPKLEANLAGAQKKIEELLISFKTEALSDTNTAKAEFNKLNETNLAAADRVRRTIVRSPVQGTINEVKVTTIGGIVQPGQDLIKIVPLNDTLLIEANIRPADIGFLRPGLPATVKISAYDFSIYGGLKAIVEHISADTITDEKGNPFYQIRVRTTERSYLIGKHGERLQIIPGMSATVDILTGQKTVLEYLLKPIIKAKKNAMRER
ncbi:MAG: HlyD family type I secretion periplasmic adaptor subunit [Proteobacteria bacterium]|nr:HlyD family type I secretion periplasmic adaptor subunit [Pseudomonadota bacterium]